MNLVTTIRRLLVGRLRWLLATGDERDAEILALRHQVLVLQRHIDRPRFTDTDRTILAVLSTAFARSRLPQIMLIVQPKTVIGWTVASSPVTAPTRQPRGVGDRRHSPRSGASPSGSHRRTQRRVTGASMASCSSSMTVPASTPDRSTTCSKPTA